MAAEAAMTGAHDATKDAESAFRRADRLPVLPRRLVDQQGQGGACLCCAPRVIHQRTGHRRGGHNGVPPPVQLDDLGQQLGAHAMAGACDRVDPEGDAHRKPRSRSSSPGSGSSGDRRTPSQDPVRSCRRASSGNARNRLRTSWVAPSGCRHAPRRSMADSRHLVESSVPATAVSQVAEHVSHRGQPEHARAALTRGLLGQVTDHAGGLRDRAGRNRHGGHDARP